MSSTAREFGIASSRVVAPSGMQDAVVVVREGHIASVLARGDAPASLKIDDLGDRILMPGLVDSHVHVNEPGRTEWEGFESATRAAAAGGITTIADMPLNSHPVTTSAAALAEKRAAAAGKLWVDVTYLGGVVPGNSGELAKMVEQGVAGFKCFLIHSGIDEFPDVREEDLDQAMPILAGLKVPLLVHAELESANPGFVWSDHRSYRQYVGSRPRRWENDAIELMIKLCRRHRCRVHIVHLSSSDALSALKRARAEGLPITAETCPHYLHFQMESIPDGDPRYKCAPPIREQENCQRLWDGLETGVIDFIVSDHSPCTPHLKHLEDGDLHKAWGGISGLQFGLTAVWSYARPRGISIEQIARWMCEHPARFLGLDRYKGRIAPGYQADLVVFDPDGYTAVEKSTIFHRHKETPYEGLRLRGRILATYLRGEKVFEDGKLCGVPRGSELLHSTLESMV